MQHFKMLINGAWTEAADGRRLDSMDPFTGEVWATIPRAGAADVEAAVDAAARALKAPAWREIAPSARAALMRKLADLIPPHAEMLADMETSDNGKLLSSTRGEVMALVKTFNYFAGLADKIEGIVAPAEFPGTLAYAQYEPIGVVAVIAPWNSPLLIAANKIANALAAGCTVVVKPSEFTSASTLAFARLFEEAGFPPGVVNVVTGTGPETGEALVTHPAVAKIQFTGGTETGRRINTMAASSFKRVVLELGGKSPNVVFDDCDLDAAIKGAILGIFTSSGQSCISGSRLLVQRNIHDRFVARLVEATRDVQLGDPRSASTQIGPISTAPQFHRIVSMLEQAQTEGAEAAMGGKAAANGLQFIEPTILINVHNDMTIAREEIFGPVLSVIPFEDEADAVRIANDTNYGLAAGVWTLDMARAFRMIKAIEAGTVWINTYRILSSTMPSTGYKESGLGSENGQRNIFNFLKPKSIYLNHGSRVSVPFLPESG
ncbi:carnitine dehydratase [Novosphingobium malaysiense]|uniref:Carnitine dehydratase n=1 Tax=Novosphingobium malaysiense TaxID=1348853 RepID=A0A0B1ZIH5_9SPHN|nr:carnitine dehydratase [Novosphingobium malaysiense]